MKMATHRSLFCTTAVIGLLVMPSYGIAGPEGGAVTAGGADIQTSGTATTITQSTDRAIIRWDSFDLNANESVQFNQPNSSSITVNRIRDNKPSQINGSISANGNIILINPNGMVFGATSTVNVGSLVATSSDLEDESAFMNGGAVKFTKPGVHDARIVNNGSMTVRDGGLVGLVGPHVENHGIIQARLGKVALASGDIHTIDFAGDGLIKLEVSDAVLSQSVTNTGTITADGGDILITAAQARGMVEALVTNTGTLRANTVTVNGVQKTGTITLSTKGLDIALPRAQGIVFNTGTIEAEGVDAGQDGGLITILSDKINIGDGSYVTASGDANGGSIRIGGEYQGGPGLPTSDMVFISEHVILTAGSRRKGDGGRIILWSDTNTIFYAHADVSGGIEGGDGGFIEISGKEWLDFTGTVDLSSVDGARGTLLLDPTDIIISNAANSNISGGSPFTATIDNGPTVLNATTLLNALSSGNVIVQTRATGAQAGDITVNAALTWVGGNTLTLDAHNNIIVNQNITGNNLRFVVGNDLQLNADLVGSGTLTIQQAADSTTVGIGASAVGTLNLNASDLTRIVNGWNEIVIGKATATAAMDVRATTWNDNLVLKSGTGVITTNGVVTLGTNNLSIVTDGDINLLNNLAGSGTLSISQSSVATGMGIGNTQTGAVNLTATEVGRITNGWSNIVLGRTDGTGALNFGTLTWNDFLTIQSGTGLINVNGTQTMGTNTLTLITDADITLTGSLTGSTSLSIYGASASTSMAFGNGETGTINFNTTEVGRFTNGWTSLNFGRTDGTGAINVGALTWNDAVTFQTGSGVISINGNQTLAANHLTFRTNADIALGGTLTSTGNLLFEQSSAGTSIGVGDGQIADLSFSNADIAQIVNGWNSITFGRTDGTQALNVGAMTWNDTAVFQTGSGVINIVGTQTMMTAGMTIRTDANVNIAADIAGNGGAFALVQSSSNASMGLGTGEAGTVHLDDDEMDRILNGWTSRTFGRIDSTADLNVGAYSWVDALNLRTGTGVLSINGAQSMATNVLTINTDGNLSLNAALAGTESLVIQSSSASTSIGLGDGQTGTLHLSDTELNFLSNGWKYIYFGNATTDGDMNIGARSWQDRIIFRNRAGQMNFNGNQNFSSNNASIITDSNLAINGTFTGTGSLTITVATATTTVGIGTGQVGMINFSDEEIDRMANTFSLITIGSTSQTGSVNIGASVWKDPLSVIHAGGLMSINGDINMNANNLTLSTNSNIVINGNLTGTGTLIFQPSTAATTMGVGTGQAGTISMTDAKLSRIIPGWANVVFGSTGMTGALNIAGKTWAHSVEYRTAGGALNINGAQNLGIYNLTIRTNTNLVISQNLAGTGSISIMPSTVSVGMGVGTGQVGALNLSDAELAYILDGWNTIIFGNTGVTAAINVGAKTWTDSVDVRTSSGVISINGAQNLGANNFTLRSDANPVIGASLTGTGSLSFIPVTKTTTVAIGTGQTGVFSFTDAELNFLTNGWNNITFGADIQTGVMNVGARTWNDNLTLNTSSGIITIAGAQTMGANNLTIRTSGNLALNAALSGTGTLKIDTNAVSSSIVLNGSGGTINLTTAELNQISNGWSDIIFGRTDSTGVVTVGAYTWNDNVTFQTGTGVITVSGVQNSGSNNITFNTNSNMVLGANLIGTGTLMFRGSASTTSIGVGLSQAGTLSLVNTELAFIQDGWSRVQFGSNDGAGIINIGAYTWLNPMTFVTGGDVILNGVQTSTESSGNSLVFATLNGAFINNAGPNAINPGGGRYLVYSVAEANDTLGGITRPGILTNKTYNGYGPSSVVEVGSQHLYSGLAAKILYLTIDDKDKAYGDALPVFSYTYTGGLINGDALTDIILSYTMTSLGSNVLDNAGTVRAITGSFSLGNGYSAVITNGSLTVVKSVISVQADNATRQYGLENPAFNVNYSGFKNGEDEADIDTLATAATAATILSNVGSYAITTSGADDDNYDFVYVDGALNITKATLTATMQAASREYGSSNPTFTANYTGFRNGESSAVIDTLALGASVANATSNVGTYSITGSGAVDNNYNFNYVNGTLSVTKATLVATANDASRIYGDSNPALGVTYSGFKNGETSSVIDISATASSSANLISNVGSYAITASGASDNNYNFTYVGGTLSVTKAMLTATAGNGTREYGDANPALGVSYTGFKNSETSAVINTLATASTAANATSNVGSYATTASGAADNNYDFTYVDGTLEVTKAMLTAAAGNGTREYGDANPALGVTYTGFKNSETSAVINTLATASSAANTTSNVGSYATTASAAADNNYDFSYVDGTLSVTKAMLSATAGNGIREYGDSNPALSVTYTGFKNSETSTVINTIATASSSANATSNVGSYITTASGASDNNYDFSYVGGTLSVTKAMLTATAGSGTREYGDANPALGITYTGFKNSETSVVINTLATASSAANTASNVGLHITTASGASDDNYDFSYVDGTLEVTKAMLTATAGNGTREYGDANPALGITYTGFKNGETSAVINTLATASSAANATSNVGSYATTASGASDNNYDFSYVGGTLSVTKAMLTATAGNGTREYGDTNPALGITYTGFKNSETSSVIDTLAIASSAANVTSNVGSYITTASGAADNNYDFSYVDGTLSVTKAMLIATAGNGTREYGDSNPAFGITYAGFKNGQTSSVIDALATASSAANVTSNVGSYITTASGAADGNYDFTYANGTFSVTKAMLTATGNTATRTYGAADPTFTATYTGFKNGETSSVINTLVSGASTANALSNVGSYGFSVSGASDNNYDFTYVDGILNVTKAMLAVTAQDASRDQGLANPSFTVSYTGFVNSENSSVIDTLASASTTANMSSAVGPYAITPSGAFDNNYTFTYVNGVLNVLDPDYVPPPPSTTPQNAQTILPTTVTNPLPSTTSLYNVVLPNKAPVIASDSYLKNVAVLDDTQDFDYMWQKDRFLIAMTNTIQNFYIIINDGENRAQ